MSDQEAATKAQKVAAYYGALYYFPRALEQVARVSMFGAGKHGVSMHRRGFLDNKYPIEMYDDAEVRHILGRAVEGEINYQDGKLLHRAQAAWNALAGLEKFLIAYEKAVIKAKAQEPKEQKEEK